MRTESVPESRAGEKCAGEPGEPLQASMDRSTADISTSASCTSRHHNKESKSQVYGQLALRLKCRQVIISSTFAAAGRSREASVPRRDEQQPGTLCENSFTASVAAEHPDLRMMTLSTRSKSKGAINSGQMGRKAYRLAAKPPLYARRPPGTAHPKTKSEGIVCV